MRYQTVLGLTLFLGGFSSGLAADPPSPPQAAATSSQTSTTASTPETGNAKAAAEAAALAAQTHRLRTAGYKPRVKDGATVWCKQETALGSRLAQVDRCGTPEQIEQSIQEAKDSVEKMQRNVTERQSN